MDDPVAFHDFTVANWSQVEAELSTRATQTNEAGRCALLLPVLASPPQPLALLEVGAAAGLGLYPDRYAYRYGDHEVGSSGPVLDFHTSVLYQVPAARRVAFTRLVAELPGHWVAVEAPDVLTYEALPPPPDQSLCNVLALDGKPLAWTRGHGQAMSWFA